MSSPSQMTNEEKSAVGTALLCPALGDAGQAGLDTIVLMLPLVILHSSAATLVDARAHARVLAGSSPARRPIAVCVSRSSQRI
jgi:hypothetical protein